MPVLVRHHGDNVVFANSGIVYEDVDFFKGKASEKFFASRCVGHVEAIDEDDPHMQAVDQVGVGDWFEFLGEADQTIRCKLAAKINVIDKYIFVTQQGVKVVEKTRAGLARELKDGTVKLISDGLLFSRALESVIGSLRASQQEQSEDAFQPPLLTEAPDALLAPVAPSH